jgi:hypothetical protein
VNDAVGVEKLLCGVHAAVPGAAAAALRGAGRWHGLALLQMNGGHPKEALQIWQVRFSMCRFPIPAYVLNKFWLGSSACCQCCLSCMCTRQQALHPLQFAQRHIDRHCFAEHMQNG